jgi:uroporphyrinogen decarboxylase
VTSRERILKSLNFQMPDRVCKDLGGMVSTGISAFTYPKLVKALGLPERLPKVYDAGQMLALPDTDVLNVLGCDVVTIYRDVTNAFEEPQKWQRYDFNGRLPALVRDAAAFEDVEDGAVIQPAGKLKMSRASYFFNEINKRRSLNLSGKLLKEDLNDIRSELEKRQLSDKEILAIKRHCQKTRDSSDKAIFYTGPIDAGLNISRGGIMVFPMLCLAEAGYVSDLHGLITEYSLKTIRNLLPEIYPYVDIIMLSADDWGTQSSLVASPVIYRDLFMPFLKQVNKQCHAIAPQVKTVFHCCGAVYDLIEMIIESGFDILNPVQWSAGQHTYRQWKDKCRNRIALWGGGINGQVTLPMGTIADIEREVFEVVSYMSRDGGYVFSSAHNILAETEPEKIIAMYNSAMKVYDN